MNLYKKVIVAFFAVLLVFSFSACKKKEIQGTEGMSPQEIIENAAVRLENVDNYTAKIKQSVTINSNGDEVGASGITEIIFFEKPLKVKVTQAQNETTQEQLKKVSYMQKETDALTVYTSYNNEWIKENKTKENEQQTLQPCNPKENVLSFLKKAKEITEEKREEADGKKVIFLRGVLAKEEIPSIVEETQALQFVGMSNLKPELYEGIDQLAITFQIEEDSGNIIGYSFDLQSIFQTLTDNTMKALGQVSQSQVSKCLVEVTFADYNNAPQIEIPQEALNAPVYAETQTQQ